MRPKNNRPQSEEERLKMLEWYKLETECDMHNYNEFLKMNKDHLRKTAINNFSKEIAKDKKAYAKKKKMLDAKSKNLIYSISSQKREWIQC